MKTELKVVLFSCSGMVIVAILVISGIVRFIFSATDTMEKAREAERVRFESLNTIKGVVINNEFYTAPFSHDTVALCFLKIAQKVIYRGGGSRGGGRRIHTGHGPKWKYDTQYIVVQNPGVQIKVGTETYPVDFTHILTTVSKTTNTPYGYSGATFDTDTKYASSLNDLYIALREDKKAWAEKEKKYNQNVEKINALYGLDEKIDRFVDNEVKGKKTPFRHLQLNEILYKSGDSIAIKGEIKNGKIVPLY
jgi:hypothetical protein